MINNIKHFFNYKRLFLLLFLLVITISGAFFFSQNKTSAAVCTRHEVSRGERLVGYLTRAQCDLAKNGTKPAPNGPGIDSCTAQCPYTDGCACPNNCVNVGVADRLENCGGVFGGEGADIASTETSTTGTNSSSGTFLCAESEVFCGGCLGKCMPNTMKCNDWIDTSCDVTPGCGDNGMVPGAGEQCCGPLVQCANDRCAPSCTLDSNPICGGIREGSNCNNGGRWTCDSTSGEGSGHCEGGAWETPQQTETNSINNATSGLDNGDLEYADAVAIYNEHCREDIAAESAEICRSLDQSLKDEANRIRYGGLEDAINENNQIINSAIESVQLNPSGLNNADAQIIYNEYCSGAKFLQASTSSCNTLANLLRTDPGKEAKNCHSFYNDQCLNHVLQVTPGEPCSSAAVNGDSEIFDGSCSQGEIEQSVCYFRPSVGCRMVVRDKLSSQTCGEAFGDKYTAVICGSFPGDEDIMTEPSIEDLVDFQDITCYHRPFIGTCERVTISLPESAQTPDIRCTKEPSGTYSGDVCGTRDGDRVTIDEDPREALFRNDASCLASCVESGIPEYQCECDNFAINSENNLYPTLDQCVTAQRSQGVSGTCDSGPLGWSISDISATVYKTCFSWDIDSNSCESHSVDASLAIDGQCSRITASWVNDCDDFEQPTNIDQPADGPASCSLWEPGSFWPWDNGSCYTIANPSASPCQDLGYGGLARGTCSEAKGAYESPEEQNNSSEAEIARDTVDNIEEGSKACYFYSLGRVCTVGETVLIDEPCSIFSGQFEESCFEDEEEEEESTGIGSVEDAQAAVSNWIESAQTAVSNAWSGLVNFVKNTDGVTTRNVVCHYDHLYDPCDTVTLPLTGDQETCYDYTALEGACPTEEREEIEPPVEEEAVNNIVAEEDPVIVTPVIEEPIDTRLTCYYTEEETGICKTTSVELASYHRSCEDLNISSGDYSSVSVRYSSNGCLGLTGVYDDSPDEVQICWEFNNGLCNIRDNPEGTPCNELSGFARYSCEEAYEAVN